MYLEHKWYYGNRIEVKKCHSSRYGVKGEKRSGRIKPTEEAVRQANERNARAALKRLLINNFDEGDWHNVLTYSPEERPDVMQAKKVLKRFFEKLRRFYKKQGLELKYIITTEWKAKNIHHHIVMNDVPGLSKFIRYAWPYGGVHMEPLYANYEYEGLADYLIKETCETFRDPLNPFRQRYSTSKNLEKPIEEVEIIKANSWRSEPTVPKSLAAAGYYIDKNSIYSGIDICGYPFQSYTMICPHRRI